ncbi:hypothetical protein [Shewanella litorisediminis]|uniref:Uncharacterized protein n=1 Tax=Shewanella litorisediminis TaxID=1173586 RepID=A0ABX7FZT7_9GAMM|nr:hypothetical protein [Shewanella litorisediminis]MCL2919637.1 hypothetical protein [Shewanella litorisediminis]QRH00528.1 hypothetical protein JQC75_11595 [Shewanella litorisediminis]
MLSIFKVLRDACFIDIFDLNWDISSEDINQVRLTKSGKYGFFEGVARYFYHIITSVLYLKFSISTFKEKVIILSGTKNQLRALSKLKNIGELVEFGTYSNSLRNNSFEAYPYLVSLIFVPVYFFKLVTERNAFKRKMLICRADRYIFSYGLYTFYSYVMNSRNTNLIILANDHSVWQRCALLVAQSKKIKVAYVQHANVSEYFPSLNFDYAFLDGKYAESVYKVSPKCKVYKVGCLRFEDFYFHNENVNITKRTGLLICFNKTDTEEEIFRVVNECINKFKGEIGIRFHPSDSRSSNYSVLMAQSNITNETHSDLGHVLGKYAYCYAGMSSIFLEASLSGMKCFTISSEYYDYYGFQRDKIIRVFQSWDDLDFASLKESVQEASYLYNCYQIDDGNVISPSNSIKKILRADGCI